MNLQRMFKIAGAVVGVLVGIIAAFAIYVLTVWDRPAGNRIPAVSVKATPDAMSRGEFLYKYGIGCWECHSTVSDPNALPSGGMVFDLRNVGPGFGILHSRNLTSDSSTGLGAWSDGEIVRAIREGVGKDGRKLFPVMPMENLHGLSDEDVQALVAYLRSLPPVVNKVEAPQYSFFAKLLFTLGAIGPKPELTAPVVAPPKGITPEYGKYVSSNAGLCSDCHSVRNLQDGSFYPDSAFAGSSINFGEPEGHPVRAYAPNITMDDETGIGRWSEEGFLQTVRFGVRPDGRGLTPIMPYASFAFWDTTDLKAVYAYLKTVPKVKRPSLGHSFSPAVLSSSGSERGKMLFEGMCQRCHGAEGRQTAYTTVKLAEVAPSLGDEDILAFVREGNIGVRMPSFGKTLKDDELKDIVAYIRTWK